MTDPHPIRIWKQDCNLGAKLGSLRRYQQDGRKKYEAPSNGIQYFELPVSVDPSLISNFLDLQGMLYQQRITTQFLGYFQHYWDNHRQMFSFDPELAECLDNTDVSAVPWNEIRLPHPEFHLCWGDYGQASFKIADLEYVIDGAYIRQIPQESVLFPNDTILITFTAQLVYPSYKEAKELRSAAWGHFSEPVYEYAISGAGVDSIGEAIEKGEAEYLKYCRSMDDQLLKLAFDWAPDLGVLPVGQRIYPFKSKFERGIEIIRSSIPLLFNVIFYLTKRPGERTLAFPKDAPSRGIKRLSSESNEKVRKSIRDSLLRKGYSEVIFIRDSEVTMTRSSSKGDRSVRAHWRRGHWRNQPFGKDLQDRKWLWIMPALVRQDEEFKVGTKHNVEQLNSESDQ